MLRNSSVCPAQFIGTAERNRAGTGILGARSKLFPKTLLRDKITCRASGPAAPKLGSDDPWLMKTRVLFYLICESSKQSHSLTPGEDTSKTKQLLVCMPCSQETITSQ